MTQPDLRTKEGAMYFINYHSPNVDTQLKHNVINNNFQDLLSDVWETLPDGPGKTRFIHALNEARMSANSCIANEGA